MKLTLASGSIARRKLLEDLELKFDVLKTDAKEVSYSANCGEYVKDLAKVKADAALLKVKEGIIIAADTVCYYNGEILGKPKSREEAIKMLYSDKERVQDVWTGVAIYDLEKNKKVIFSECTKVYLDKMDMEDVEFYIDNDETVYKRAGAYSINGRNSFFTKKIEGDYTNVIGLPVCRIYAELKKLGYSLKDFM